MPESAQAAQADQTSGVLGVIPARLQSTRFPEKMLADIAGKPLLQWTVERAQQASRLNDLLVATDAPRIADLCQSIGVAHVMTRKDHPSGTDRVAEAAASLTNPPAAVINIQGDEPLIDPALIDQLAERLLVGRDGRDSRNTIDMVTAMTPIDCVDDLHNPSIVKVVTDNTGLALYFSRACIPHFRDETPEEAFATGLHRRHLGIYGYQTEFLQRLVAAPPSPLETAERLEQLRALGLGARLLVLKTDSPGPGVDRPEDVARAVEALREAGLL